MELLNALLAFSVAMLVFSTMSLVLVEVLHRFHRTREKYFAEMINVFFDELVWSKLKDHIPQVQGNLTANGQINADSQKAKLEKNFLDIMTSVSGLVALDIELATDDDQSTKSKASTRLKTKTTVGLIKPKTTERLTTVEFAQRLARTEAGQMLLNLGTQKAKAVVLDLASQLNAVSAGSTSDFKQRSRKLALIASAVIAFSLNIDSIYMFKKFSVDQELTQSVIEQAPEAIEAYQQQQQIIDKLEDELQGTTDSAKKAIEKLKDHISQSQQKIKQSSLSLSELGVPFGMQYFPWCKPIGSGQTNSANSTIYIDSRCQYSIEASPKQPDSNEASSQQSVNYFIIASNYLSWFGGVVLSVVLIGQGSPFWFQLFQKLSLTLQLLKNISLGAAKKTPNKSPEQEQDDYSPERAVEIYLQTISAQPNQPIITPKSNLPDSPFIPLSPSRKLLSVTGTKE